MSIGRSFAGARSFFTNIFTIYIVIYPIERNQRIQSNKLKNNLI